MFTVLSVFGTRPEAIKFAPILRELANHPDDLRSVVCVTAQHRQMLDQVLDLFHIMPDYDLNLMQERQTLSRLTAHTLTALEPVLTEVQPDWVLVQGDTTTTMVTSLLAFYHHIKLAHIEAGLRTSNKHAPFPEEINRRITSVVADMHFAPTELARQALLAEGVSDAAIHVTGNTVVDALLWARDLVQLRPTPLPDGLREAVRGKRLILVTGHRRESFGEGFEQICLALRDLAQSHPEFVIVYPVHLNPSVQEPVYRLLGEMRGVHLIDPIPYASFVWLMNQAYLILTDSGGVQEEAPSLGKPVLVMRETTERSEGIDAGCACLVGVNHMHIVEQAQDLLTNDDRYRRMSVPKNPYGDGHAAQRVVELLLKNLLSNSESGDTEREMCAEWRYSRCPD
jgi:UDP-N-acetylglucosamine 2-epimerase (non-hydrolysing)